MDKYNFKSPELQNEIDKLINIDLSLCNKDEEAGYRNSLVHRIAYEDLMMKQSPNLFWTINFIHPDRKTKNIDKKKDKSIKLISDQQATKSLNELIKRINQKFFRRNRAKYMKGIGCLDYQKCGQPHFHLLINFDTNTEQLIQSVDERLSMAKKRQIQSKQAQPELKTLSIELLIELAENGGDVEALRKDYELFQKEVIAKKKLMDVRNPFLCINRKAMDVQEVYSDDVAEYVAKVFEPTNRGRIVLIDKDGICDPDVGIKKSVFDV